jgi:hypothetical protein
MMAWQIGEVASGLPAIGDPSGWSVPILKCFQNEQSWLPPRLGETVLFFQFTISFTTGKSGQDIFNCSMSLEMIVLQWRFPLPFCAPLAVPRGCFCCAFAPCGF